MQRINPLFAYATLVCNVLNPVVLWSTQARACVALRFVMPTPDYFATRQAVRVPAVSLLIVLLKMEVWLIPMNARVAQNFAMPPLGCFVALPQTKDIEPIWVNAVLRR